MIKRMISLILAVLLTVGFAACGSEEIEGQSSPVKENTSAVSKKPKAEESSQKEEPSAAQSSAQDDTETEYTDPEPSQGLDAYAFPADHPHEGKDLTVFDGIYRAEAPAEDFDETWVEITGFNDFILLEYFGVMEGSVCSFEAEEFWPDDGWYTDTTADAVSGKSQRFSSMGPDGYFGLPEACGICLTADGVRLDRSGETEELIRDSGLTGGHTDAETMRSVLGDSARFDFDVQHHNFDVVGSWGYWNGISAMNLQLSEDGTFRLFRKYAGEPIEVYKGVYGFTGNSAGLAVYAERAGFGGEPYIADIEWYIDELGINLMDTDGVFFDEEVNLWAVEYDFFTGLNRDRAVGYVFESLCEEGEYTDQYDTTYLYSYRLPKFYGSDHAELEEINDAILSGYMPIIEGEFNAMDIGEFLSYDYVGYEIDAYEGVLFLHVYAYTYDWEEHSVFYIDTETMKPIEPVEMLSRIGITETEFLDTVRERAREVFEMTFSEIPEEEREVYGYDECLEETVSETCVNVDLPVFVDHFGDIRVYLRISSPAGSGTMYVPEYPFGMSDTCIDIG